MMQNFILVAGAETRRTFAQGEERKYPGEITCTTDRYILLTEVIAALL